MRLHGVTAGGPASRDTTVAQQRRVGRLLLAGDPDLPSDDEPFETEEPFTGRGAGMSDSAGGVSGSGRGAVRPKRGHAARNIVIIVLVLLVVLVVLFAVPIPIAFSERVASSPTMPSPCGPSKILGSHTRVQGTFSSSTGQAVDLYIYGSPPGYCAGGKSLNFTAPPGGSGTFSFVSGGGLTYYFFAITSTPGTVSISGTYTGPLL
jgi:hypothetical protein